MLYTAANSGVANNPLICLGGDMWCLFPWLSSYAFLALERFLKLKCASRVRLKGLDSSRPYFMQFKMKAGRDEFFQGLAELEQYPLDAMKLVYPDEVPLFEKYDEYLPAELVKRDLPMGSWVWMK